MAPGAAGAERLATDAGTAAPSIPYQPGLDGLRAVAVGAVLLYHGGVAWMRGGFLGVDIFFVLSGYLITTLLLVEWGRTGRIRLLAFWARRARRLLPALALLLVGVVLFGLLVAAPETLDRLRDDALSAIGYVANWRFIASGQGYFDQFAEPSPLRHTWSLAIEEQFYLLWPFILLALLHWRPRLTTLARVFAAGAIVSAALMAVLVNPGGDPSRVYYGTDTRAQALLVGAALAAVTLRLRTRRDGPGPGAPWVRAGVAGGVVLGLLLVLVRDTSSWMYRGGYLLAAVATAAVIGAAIQPKRNAIRSALGPAPLRWVGAISYGLYLWHWPVYLTLTNERTGLDGTGLLVVRIAVSFAAATVSYYLVELPVRHRQLLRDVPRALVAIPVVAAILAFAFLAIPTVRGDESGEVAAVGRTEPAPPGSTTPPASVLVVGDSVARTMGDGFDRASHAAGVELFNRGQLACGLAQRGRIERGGQWVDTEPACDGWPTQWKSWVDEIAPEVSVVLFDVFVVSDLEIDGATLELGSKASDAYLRKQLERGIAILRSHDGRVVLLTAPYNHRPEVVGQPARWAEDDRARVDHWNEVLRSVVEDLGDSAVTLADLNDHLSPQGRYTNTRKGVELRYDGVHFNPEAGELVFGWLLPQLGAPQAETI